MHNVGKTLQTAMMGSAQELCSSALCHTSPSYAGTSSPADSKELQQLLVLRF